MPLAIPLESYDELFHSTTAENFIINHIDIFNPEHKEKLDHILFNNFDSDNISLIPSCMCGHIKGTYHIGTKCEVCSTYVRSKSISEINFILWAKRPESVESFINLSFLNSLLKRYKLSKPSMSVVTWLIDTNFNPVKKANQENNKELMIIEQELQLRGIKRGYNSFVENIIEIVTILENVLKKKKVKKSSNEETKEEIEDDIVTFIRNNRKYIFSDYLPFINRLLVSIDSTELGRFTDKNLTKCVNVVRRLTGIDINKRSSIVKQNKIAKSLIELAEFYEDFNYTSNFQKYALIRQHISSTRSHFTMRCVATLIVGPHNYDDIHLPWSGTLSLLRPHVLSKLSLRGYDYRWSLDHYMKHIRVYSSLLHEILLELKSDNGGYIPVLVGRNPSLHRGSIVNMKGVVIKTDPDDRSVSVGPLSVRSMNLDFDGDELNVSLIYSKIIAEQANNFDQHLSVIDLDSPDSFTNCFAFPKPVIGIMSNWYRDGNIFPEDIQHQQQNL